MIGPGGIYFYALFGQMCRLHRDGHLNDLKELSGSSAGSLTGFLYLLGRKKLEKVKEYIFTCDYGDTFQMNPMRLIKKHGLIDTFAARNFLATLCSRVFGFTDVTFEQLYARTGVIFHISSLSLLKNDVEYFSVRTAPNMSVIDAVCMSVAAPFVFTPFKNHIDAGMFEFLPYSPFIGKDNVVSIMNEQDAFIPVKKGILSYMFHILNLISRLRRNEEFSHRIIIPSLEKGVFDFKQLPSDRMRLFAHGFNTPSNLPSPTESSCVTHVGRDTLDQSESCTGQDATRTEEPHTNQHNHQDLYDSVKNEAFQSSEDIHQVYTEAPFEPSENCDNTPVSASVNTVYSEPGGESGGLDKSSSDHTTLQMSWPGSSYHYPVSASR